MINRLRQQLASEQSWFFVIVAIALTPLVQALLTTTWDGFVTYPQAVIRVLSVVTILTQLFIVIVAMKLGLLRFIGSAVPASAKLLLVLLFSSTICSVFLHRNMVIFSVFITLRFFLQLAALFSLIHILSTLRPLNSDRYFKIMTCGMCLYVGYIIVIISMIVDYAIFNWSSGLPSATSIRHIGNYVAILSIAAMGVFLFAKPRLGWLALFAVFFVIAFLAWTGSRAAFVGLVFALPVAVFVVRNSVSARRISVLVTTLVAAVLVTIPLPVPDAAYGYGLKRMVTATDARQKGDISSGRKDVWKHTIEEIEQAPVFGHGAGRFIGNMDAKYKYDLDNPHNFILQFAYDWGLIGAALALALLAMGIIGLFKLPMISPLATFCAVSGLMLMLSIGMLEGMFYHPLKMLLVSALVAPAFALARLRTNS